MRERKNPYRIREAAGVFGASSSAYSRRAEQRSKRDAELLGHIRKLQLRHHRRYGSPRVPEALGDDDGERISRNKTARLMGEDGLNARRRGRFIPTVNSNRGLPVGENRLNREFQAEKRGSKGRRRTEGTPSLIWGSGAGGYTWRPCRTFMIGSLSAGP